MGIHPIKRVNISEQVFVQLKDQILKGEWKQGDRLPSENELAAALGVSRVTVRQAIQRLTALGLVETKLGEGSFIRTLTPGAYMNHMIPMAYLNDNSMREVLEFRRAIESTTAELAAQKADERDIRALEDILQKMRDDKDDMRKFSRADFEFHLELARMTKNSLIIETYNILSDLLKTALERIVSHRGNSQGLYYHDLLLQAVKEHDAEKCRRIMTEHLNDTYDSMMELEPKA